MLSDEEIEAAAKVMEKLTTERGFLRWDETARAALEAAARVRAEANNECDDKHDAEETCDKAAAFRALQEENEALADALRGVLKAYENAIDWYDYLLSRHINQKEAERRLRLLRQARRAALQEHGR